MKYNAMHENNTFSSDGKMLKVSKIVYHYSKPTKDLMYGVLLSK